MYNVSTSFGEGMASRTGRKAELVEREDAPVSIKAARQSFGDLVNTAAYGNRIVPISRRGKVVAAVIGKKDVQRLRDLDASAA